LREEANDPFLYPEGYKLEDILTIVRQDNIKRLGLIAADKRLEAGRVTANNIQILQKITESIELAEISTQVLDRTFGQSGMEPRIGAA
jgi:hypothetical protein